MEELDLEPVAPAANELADPVALLESEHERVHHVLGAVELIEAEDERGGGLAGDEEQTPFDVVGAAEVVSLVERELPLGAVLDPVLDRLRELAIGSVTLTLTEASARSSGVGRG